MNDERRPFMSPDPLAYIFGRSQRDAPGERWYYNGGASVVLAGVIEQLTGRPVLEFAKDTFFAPVGHHGLRLGRAGRVASE